MSERPKFLIVCLRRIGDVLMSTPISASIRASYPLAKIDWLVFESTAPMLRDNPAADDVLIHPDRPKISETFALMRAVFMRYDFAVSAQSGDRPAWFARIAARRAFSLASQARGGWFRNLLMTAVSHPAAEMHRQDQILTLATLLSLVQKAMVLTPRSSMSPPIDASGPYWVLHPGAAFRYKRWNVAAWRELVKYLRGRGQIVLVSGGNAAGETRYLDVIFQGLEVTRLDGKLSWSELVAVISNAEGYVGVDTSTTHLAAALDIPVFAVFGPTDPALWAPKSSQSALSVRVIQNSDMDCVPCQLEGCDRHIESGSRCLDMLSASAVIAQIENIRQDRIE